MWVTVSEALFWVSVSYFGWAGHYFGWVGVSGGIWCIILGDWGWVGYYFGWVGEGVKIFWVSGGGWGWAGVTALFDNTRSQHVKKLKKLVQEFHIRFSCSFFSRCSSSDFQLYLKTVVGKCLSIFQFKNWIAEHIKCTSF